MKKRIIVLLAFALVLSLAGCSSGEPAATTEPPATSAPATSASAPVETGGQSSGGAPVAEEVKGVTIPEFSITVNGVEVTQEEVASYPVYSVQATSVNSSGTESTTAYVGFAMKDILEAAGLSETYVWLEATASDGYAATFTGDIIYEDTTLLAISKDGSPFGEAPWFAPCTDGTTGNYIKDTVSILVNTTEGKPDVSAPPAATGEDEASGEPAPAVGEKPEILDRTDKVEFQPFTFKVNGSDVDNAKLEGLSIYKISATTTNSNGESVTSDYTGYKLADVLAACGAEGYTTVKAVANDGYETELTAGQADSDYTLVAIEKDKETGEDGTIWLAPCEEAESKSYAKLVVEIIAE